MKKYTIKKTYMAGIAALVLVVGSLSLSSAYATNQIDLSKSCSLTLNVADSGSYAEDLADAKLHANLYLVASVDENGTYTVSEDYVSLELEKIMYEGSSQSEKATEAAKIAADKTADAEITLEEGTGTAENLKAGMYLVVVEKGETTTYEYTFSPYFICLPDNLYTRTGNPEDNYYQYDVTGGLKPERGEKYGQLKVCKTLTSYNASLQDVTFVFQIEGVDENGTLVYSNVVSTTHNGPGTKEVLVDHIPAGITVTVTEVYSGASYTVSGSATGSAVIAADNIAMVAFTNTYSDALVPGYGVTNHFEYDENEGWKWSQLTDNSTANK